MRVRRLRASARRALYCCFAAQNLFLSMACSLLEVASGISVMKEGVVALGIFNYIGLATEKI